MSTTDLRLVCPDCDNRADSCDRCDGTGEAPDACDRCDGRGYVRVSSFGPDLTDDCPTCLGSGLQWPGAQ